MFIVAMFGVKALYVKIVALVIVRWFNSLGSLEAKTDYDSRKHL